MMDTRDDQQVPEGAGDEEAMETSVFPGFPNVNEFSQEALKAVLQATKSSNGLPVGDNFDFYSTFRSVRDVMDIESKKILSLIQRLLRHQGVRGSLRPGEAGEVDDRFDLVLDVNDQLLERVATSLDEAAGLKKEEKKLVVATAALASPTQASSWNKKVAASTNKAASAYRLLTAKNIQRPQLKFKDKIDNSKLPYRPQIRVKPHAILPLEESLQLPEGVSIEDTEDPNFSYPHPYKVELDRFQPSEDQLKRVEPKEAGSPMSLWPLLMVTSVAALDKMLDDLRGQQEVAVDLEAHTYRSYQGFVCLMQISTRTHDYILDTLELRSEMWKLNEIFTNPSVTKVLHGADSDVVWLQRDFGLYLVNLFDTGQAARVLGEPRFSLAHLLAKHCGIAADKQFQLADWRIRPLPQELISYAREDTHHLLYIYDKLRNLLLDQGNSQQNLLRSVYDRSARVAAKVYRKPGASQDDVMELYRKSRKAFTSQQMACLRALHSWRDLQARQEDESLGYVLPNHMLLAVAELLPRERQGVLACCQPVPPLVRASLPELHGLVMAAREVALDTLVEKKAPQPTQEMHPRYNVSSLLSCPHDQSHLDKMPFSQISQSDSSLAAPKGSMFSQLNGSASSLQKTSPIVSAFNPSKSLINAVAQALAAEVKKMFSSPFTKYIAGQKTDVKPMKRDVWKMKPITGSKRKADKTEVDLDTFEPEFVPPSKRAKKDDTSQPVSNPGSTSNISNNASSSLFKIPDVSSSEKKQQSNSVSQSNPQPTTTTGEAVGKQIKSLRQEINSKKKKEKKKEKLREKKKNLVDSSDTSNKIEDLEITFRNEEIKPASEPGSDELKEPVKPSLFVAKASDKKKKKAKLTMDDVRSASSFDYAAAETSLSKANKSKKKDFYDCALPSRNGKKDQVKKPRLSGATSNKSISFDSKRK